MLARPRPTTARLAPACKEGSHGPDPMAARPLPRSRTVMKALMGLLIATTLVIGSGCTKTDWIESTLVTVDLTGVWQGTYRTDGAIGTGNITLTLQQGGTKVTGQVGLSMSAPGSRSIEGTINGDMFRFRTQDGRLTGELQVSGDEMTGRGQGPRGQVQYSLRR
jgi:hypothetical protein